MNITRIAPLREGLDSYRVEHNVDGLADTLTMHVASGTPAETVETRATEATTRRITEVRSWTDAERHAVFAPAIGARVIVEGKGHGVVVANHIGARRYPELVWVWIDRQAEMLPQGFPVRMLEPEPPTPAALIA